MAPEEMITDPLLKNVLQMAAATREQALTLLDLVDKHALDTERTASSPTLSEIQLQVSKQQKLLYAQIAQLRGLHREATLGARETKALTAEARQEVDRLHLQLQNLYYEQRHLRGEISACASYDHKYQSLPLVPVEQFLLDHPECVGLDETALTVARIENEREEREALEQQRQGLLKKKQGLIAENKKRKDDLANLDKDLEKFIDAAKPIQKTFEKVV